MRFLDAACLRPVRPLQLSQRRTQIIKAEGVSGADVPNSFEACVSQACQAIRSNVFGAKKSRTRRVKSLRRLSVEIPVMDTGVEKTLYLTSQLLKVLESDGRGDASVIYSTMDHIQAAQQRFPGNLIVYAGDALDSTLSSRLLVFNPTAENEDALYALLEDEWRGEVVLLLNPEFSDDFKTKHVQFLQAFDTVYCFMPLAIKLFIQSKEGALFRWQKEKGMDAKWHILMEEKQGLRQIGQQASRPTQEELELAIYNATAADSPITKGVKFLTSLRKQK